ncbi:hypothetical protein BDV59DRAFT_159713 [Aspergillus ambiguus]|uniref:uncharacterized protein n=1 Tax=Aspergillus ambiguus TaxID=176160 RepID=UPI003CCE53F5
MHYAVRSIWNGDFLRTPYCVDKQPESDRSFSNPKRGGGPTFFPYQLLGSIVLSITLSHWFYGRGSTSETVTSVLPGRPFL